MKLPNLARLAARWLIQPKREPDFLIGPEHDPYMERWWLIPRNRFFNIYLHHIRHSDDNRALHDHPWWSLSIMLQGRLHENYVNRPGAFGFDGWKRTRLLTQGSVVWRSSRFAHRLILLHHMAAWHGGIPSVWTLFITGPRIRDWGFICPKGWVPWQKFCAVDNPGEVGRGCGEME
jgi:hypothetical protein